MWMEKDKKGVLVKSYHMHGAKNRNLVPLTDFKKQLGFIKFIHFFPGSEGIRVHMTHTLKMEVLNISSHIENINSNFLRIFLIHMATYSTNMYGISYQQQCISCLSSQSIWQPTVAIWMGSAINNNVLCIFLIKIATYSSNANGISYAHFYDAV